MGFNQDNQIQAMITLLTDQDEQTVDLVKKSLIGLGDEAVPAILRACDMGGGNIRSRLEAVLEEIHFKQLEDEGRLANTFKGAQAILSAVPYYLNPQVAQAAITAGVSMCDLGGDTPTVFKERALHDRAKAAGLGVEMDF